MKIFSLVLTVATMVVAFLSLPQNCVAQDDTPGVEIANLQQQLESGLKARRPEEFKFIEGIVHQVERGELPIKLVKSAFSWSRKRNKKTPFPYFHHSVILLAKRIDVVIQPLESFN